MHLYAKVITGSILLFSLYNFRWFTQRIKQKDAPIWEPFNSTNPPKIKRKDAPIWEPFNSTNPHIGWCPHADCYNSPICTPCRRRFLLIIATGRSGSTTLLSMINQLPGVRLSGENKDALLSQMRFTDNFFKESKIKPNKNQGKRLSSSSSCCYCRFYCCCYRSCFITMGCSALNGDSSSSPSLRSSSSSPIVSYISPPIYRHRHRR